ncbi:MAG: cytochrome-c peroxidase [Polyangiaceae bacterium]|nr:cytochrome-c peroxidase [Polyangiaceae bacterium]
MRVDGSNTATCDLGSGFDAAECAWLHALRLPESGLEPARGNAVAERRDAALFGMNVFYDARFSATADVRCATCHDPEYAFTGRRSRFEALLPRSSPTLLDAMGSRWLFWDGRADSGWAQALGPFENAKEMGSNRLNIAHRVYANYRAQYEGLFGPLPPLDGIPASGGQPPRFPADGRPGDAAWASMAPADRKAVDTVFVNVGKAIEAFERRVVTGPSPFDAFLDGDRDAVAEEAKAGARIFFRSGCARCHGGPRLTDGAFHNLGVPDADPQSAMGRQRGIELLLADEFNAAGPHFDGPPPSDFPPKTSGQDLGAFRTPSLRNVGVTAPYGHTGQYNTLEDIVDFHLQGGGRARTDLVGTVDPLLEPVRLQGADRAALVAFLRALTGSGPAVPWDTWPSR